MAGTLFVVCVPTKEYEELALNIVPSDKRRSQREGLKPIASDGNLVVEPKDSHLLSSPVHTLCRSRSEESILSTGKSRQEGTSKSQREMFIGPWRVDAPELSPRAGVSRSEPDELHVNPKSTSFRDSFKEKKHEPMEAKLEKILKLLKVNNAVWCKGRSVKYYQVLFSLESGAPCEEALKLLGERGIGVLLDSAVSVIPCVLYYQGSEKSASSSAEDLPSSGELREEDGLRVKDTSAGQGLQAGRGPDDGCQTHASPQPQGHPLGQPRSRSEPGVWERFVQSVRARLTVAQVVEGVRSNASFTFDFLLLLIVAALVAALGLLENSTVILVASMLISPLMGPVMAATFGTTIRDRDLQRMGLINECVGLLLCLVIGFLLGLLVGFLDQPWPTEEMLDRGQLRSLWVNVLIALLSGAGISIALLRDNTGSLVGVAISASLLPPAVNAGLLWAMSLVHLVTGDMPGMGTDELPQFTSHYSENPAVELAVMGGISLCLTFINIVFIVLTGILLLKVKEVAPHSQSQLFWRHDVKIARDYNTTMYGASAAEMLRSVTQRDKPSAAEHRSGQTTRLSPQLDRLLRMPEYGPPGAHMCPLHQLTWSPSTLGRGQAPSSVQELEDLYRTLRMRQRHAARRSTIFEEVPTWRLGSSDGCHPLRAMSMAGLPQKRRFPPPRTPPSQDMLGPEPDFDPHNASVPRPGSYPHTPLSLYFTPNNEDSVGKRTVLSVTNETDYLEERRPAKKRRFVVTRADDSELLLPPP